MTYDDTLSKDNSKPIFLNNDTFNNMLDDAVKKHIGSKDYWQKIIGELDDLVSQSFSVTFGNRIQNQLDRFVPVYIECGGTIEEAIDIVFSKKILRKLEDRYDQDTKTKLKELAEYVKDAYPKLVRTIELANKMSDRI